MASVPPSEARQPAGRAETRRVQKTLTVLFIDLVDSTPLSERLDVSSFDGVISRFHDEVGQVLAANHCNLVKFAGDGAMAVFGEPVLADDDALRSVRAAIALRAMLDRLNEELFQTWNVRLELRIGVNTGKALVSRPNGQESDVLGHSVNVASHLQEAAQPGEILIGDLTYQLLRATVEVEPAPDLALREQGIPIAAWRLIDVNADNEPQRRRADAPMIGRDHELRLLHESFERAVAQRTCHLITVTGEAGVGKSRLATEFVQELGDQAKVLHGQCQTYGEGITYWPIARMLQQAAGIQRGDPAETARERLAKLVGGNRGVLAGVARLLGLPGNPGGEPEDVHRAIRNAFHHMASHQPLILIVEDLHSAQPPLLELITRLAESLRDSSVLFICLARSELLDRHPGRSLSVPNASSMYLRPLNLSQSERLTSLLLAEGELHPDMRARISRRTGGNPLFIEELIAMLLDTMTLRLDAGRWTPTDLADLPKAPRIDAVLDARLDRLNEEEKLVLERAAVVGNRFSPAEVAALMDLPVLEEVARALEALARKDLLCFAPNLAAEELGDDVYRFRHALIKESAYRRIAMDVLADLHCRYAKWRSERIGDDKPHGNQILGYHYGMAHRCWVQARGSDQRAHELAVLAGEHLAIAGHEQVVQGSLPAAVITLRRAVELLPKDHPGRLLVLLDYADSLRDDQLEDADASYRQVLDEAAALGDERLKQHGVIGRHELLWFRSIQGDVRQSHDAIDRAIHVFESHDDKLGLAKARRLRAYILAATGASTRALEEADRAIELARQAEDARLEAKIRRLQGIILFWGPTPLSEVAVRVRQDVEWARQRGMYSLEAGALSILARVAAMQNDVDEARQLLEQTKAITPDLDEILTVTTEVMSEGLVELYADDPEASAAALDRGLRILERRGSGTARADLAALLAQCRLRQKRYDEALTLTEICEHAAAAESLHDTQIKWRELRAAVLARKGQLDLAEPLAREAVERSSRSEHFDSRGAALLTLAEILRDRELPREAARFASDALRVYRDKGDLVSTERARLLLAELE